MSIKHAIGISINGNNVKAAFMSRIKGRVFVQGLQSITLAGPLESSMPETGNGTVEEDISSSLEQAFDLHALPSEDEEADDSLAVKNKNTNVSMIYSMLDKFKDVNTRVGINAPVLTVKYEMLDTDTVPKESEMRKSLREKIGFGDIGSNGAHRSMYHKIDSENTLRIEYEHHPPVLDLIDEVNQFRRNDLKLGLMDSNELALAFLVAKCYKLRKDYTTAIVYVEPDFSRVIFLRGKKIQHITPIIHKGSISEDVLNVVYSKIIFAQDHHLVPELDKIVLASRSAKLKAKTFFKRKFPSAKISYLNSKLIGSEYSFDNKGRLFSQYAIPIAFAWKLLQKKSTFASLPNLLPEYILERSKMPKLAFHGYMLLFLLGITAFAFTYLLVTKNTQIHKINRKNKAVEAQIKNNQPLVEKVKYYDQQIYKLDRNIAMVDSFSQNYDQVYLFLDALNTGMSSTPGVWLSGLEIKGKKVKINGYAKQRNSIPQFSEALGGASLKKVTRAELHGQKVFDFQLDKSLGAQSNTQNLELLTGLTKDKSRRAKSGNGTASNGYYKKNAPQTPSSNK